MNIGSLYIEPGAALAPMAGATDKAMRLLSVRYGAVYTISEMVSARAIKMGDKKSPRLLRGAGAGKPYGIQLFGAITSDFYDAIKLIEQMDIKYDFIDINMGCPAPKIISSGAGSALLKSPKLASEIAASTVKAANVPVTVKIRLGWDMNSITGCEIAKRCEDAGVSAVCVHARTREEMYNPGVHLDLLANIKKALKIPVIANGDVDSANAALFTLEQTGCDSVMVGRAAMGNPWLFREIAAALKNEQIPKAPTLDERLEVMREHISLMCEQKGEHIAMNEARSHAAWYMHGLNGAASLRRECCAMSEFRDLDYLISLARSLQA